MFVEIQPPNLNADLYRNHQEVNKQYNHISFINIHEEGSTIVGASDLTGRHWDGCIEIGNSSWDFVLESSSELNISKIFTDKTITDGKFLKDPTKIVVADDGGELRVWSKQKSWSDMGTPTPRFGWCISGEVIEHDDAIHALDVFPNDDLCITAGADYIIKVWDLEKLMSMVTYPAHSNIVTDVKFNPSTKNIFLSSSLDKSVVLWHFKGNENKAKVFGKVPCAAHCVCWISETLFAAGYDNGDVSFYDSRYESNDEVLPSIHLKYPIEKMKFNAESKLLAVCGDSNSVDVFKMNETDSDSIYSNKTAHSKFIRGLEWDKEYLYTGGWDGKIVNHDVLSNKLQMK